MAEQLLAPERKFLCPRDQVLYLISCKGLANESSGNNESPSGKFWLVTNTRGRLQEVYGEVASEVGVIEQLSPMELIGNWVVTEDHLGFVEAIGYDSERQARYVYDVLHGMFRDWQQGVM